MEPHSDVTDIIEIAMKIKYVINSLYNVSNIKYRTENYHPELPANTDPQFSSLMLSCWRPLAADRPVSFVVKFPVHKI